MAAQDRDGRTCIKCHSEHNGRSYELVNRQDLMRHFDHNSTGYRLEGKHSQAACSACHNPERISPSERQIISIKDLSRTFLGLSRSCTSCHTDFHKGQLSQDCNNCHDDWTWKKAPRFEHNKARFALAGNHLKVPCNKCHAVDPATQTVKYTGIEFKDCAPCHQDPHRGAFRSACNSCHHAASDWKTTVPSTVFRHSATRFPLLGRHAAIACDACHHQGDFKQTLAFGECRDCHKPDPHRGQFASNGKSGDCDACHTQENFKPSTFGLSQHNQTRFPLLQRHSEIACAKCHVADATGSVLYKISDFSCIACHRDIHEAQFQPEPYRNRCESCHDESRFKPSTFTAIQHRLTGFPLSGGHAKPACAECHKPDPKSQVVRFRFEDQSCTVCHEDPHQNRFAARETVLLPGGRKAGCEACHTVNSWRELDKFDHSSTRFALEGAHRTTACDKCHVQTKANSAKFEMSVSAECSACHEDPHKGQFAMRMAAAGQDGKPAGCGVCHSAADWHELSRFDHNTTRFALTGGHKSVTCEKCHKNPDPALGVKAIVYASAPTTCAGCHEDAHAGQFSSGSISPDCSRCHQLQAWKPSTFDHATQSTFSLSGAHSKVRCELCHTQSKTVSGKVVVVYKGTPRSCADCHTSNSTTGRQP